MMKVGLQPEQPFTCRATGGWMERHLLIYVTGKQCRSRRRKAMRIALLVAILGLSACTTVQPAEPVVVTQPRPATTVVVPAKPVTYIPAQ